MADYFITGTDTDVGKTLVASLLLDHWKRKGLSTTGFKPIAAGCERTSYGLRNEDALTLQQHCSMDLDYDLVNPFAFEPPIAPHIAATLVNQRLDIDQLSQAYQSIARLAADINLIEGAGGWCLPINDQQFMYQWVNKEQFEVILVVGIKLGCLNHALLTQAFIRSQGLKLVGWVANLVDPETQYIEQNIQTLAASLDCPLLARVPFIENLQTTVIDFKI